MRRWPYPRLLARRESSWWTSWGLTGVRDAREHRRELVLGCLRDGLRGPVQEISRSVGLHEPDVERGPHRGALGLGAVLGDPSEELTRGAQNGERVVTGGVARHLVLVQEALLILDRHFMGTAVHDVRRGVHVSGLPVPPDRHHAARAEKHGEDRLLRAQTG